MGNSLLDVCGGEYSKWPEVVAEICINEHGTCHAANGEVGAFSNAVLERGVGYCFFIAYPVCCAELLHLTMYNFRSIVDLKKRKFLVAKVFSGRFELGEQ